MKHQLVRSALGRGGSLLAPGARTSTTVAINSRLSEVKPFDQMPKMPMVPLLGSAWVFLPIIGKYSLLRQHLADGDKHRKYGDVVRERFGHLDIVFSFNPKDMETMIKSEGRYPMRPEVEVFKAYRESRKEWYKNNGIMLMNGKEWWDLRSKLQRHLMKPKAIQAFLNPIQDVAGDFVQKIYFERNDNNEVPDLLNDLYKWALESVALVGLDTRLGCLSRNLSPDSDGLQAIQSVDTMFDCVNKLEPIMGNFPFWKYLPSPTFKKFVHANDAFTKIAFKHIHRSVEALAKKGPDEDLTMLQNMLMTKDLDESDAMVMVADLLMAGIETTTYMVAFLLYHLAKNPAKQEILFEELRQLLPNKSDRITPEVFNKLHYLKACLKESIRMDPIIRGNGRVLEQDAVVSGYHVPAGTTLLVLMQQIYRNEKYFKKADQYLPERWMSKEEKPENPFAFLPFGFGTRSCVGRRLAELEVYCLATEILRNFRVEYHHEDFGMYTRLVNIPDKPLRYNFIER